MKALLKVKKVPVPYNWYCPDSVMRTYRPIGCSPMYLMLFKNNDSTSYDDKGCLKGLNTFARYHNQYLQNALQQLLNGFLPMVHNLNGEFGQSFYGYGPFSNWYLGDDDSSLAELGKYYKEPGICQVLGWLLEMVMCEPQAIWIGSLRHCFLWIRQILNTNSVEPAQQSCEIPPHLSSKPEPFSSLQRFVCLKLFWVVPMAQDIAFPDDQKGFVSREYSNTPRYCDDLIIVSFHLNRGTPQIEVTFEVDANGVLNIKAEDKAGVKSEKITITNDKGRLSQEEIDRMVQEAEEFVEEDKKVKEKIDARNSLETYIYNMKNQINDKDKLADKLESGEGKD
ncbi:hypothetical protein IFM89_016507 [Coptis chinensis]|uniref:Uncharacterized protein n=1 Tax=Coptis chinensis TaxID=261450 RepID=A0A835M868_9MAGN|nr:hypothetical protein IFM89_016507 [Coptis chinensis]